jgi:hypothetical protein
VVRDGSATKGRHLFSLAQKIRWRVIYLDKLAISFRLTRPRRLTAATSGVPELTKPWRPNYRAIAHAPEFNSGRSGMLLHTAGSSSDQNVASGACKSLVMRSALLLHAIKLNLASPGRKSTMEIVHSIVLHRGENRYLINATSCG